MTAKDVLKMAKEKGAKIIDLRFIDLPGLWQHFSIPQIGRASCRERV